MPTSSQAMILRGMDIPKSSDVSFRCFRPVKWKCFKPKPPESPRKMYGSNGNGNTDGERVCDNKENTNQRHLQSPKLYNKKCSRRFGVDFAKETNNSISFASDLYADARPPNITPTSISEFTFGSWEHSKAPEDISRFHTGFRNHVASSEGSLNRHGLKQEHGKAAKKSTSEFSTSSAQGGLSWNGFGNASQKEASSRDFTQFSYADQVQQSKMVKSVKSGCKVEPPQKKSLLEEVKECVNWKKRVKPTTFVRHSPPRPRQNTVCFNLKDGHLYSHTELKHLVEKQINCKVKGLQFDPVSVRIFDPGCQDRWLVTFRSRAECDRAVQTGLEVGEETVKVQVWNDLVREELDLRDSSMAAFGDPGTYNKRRNFEANRHNLALKKFLSIH